MLSFNTDNLRWTQIDVARLFQFELVFLSISMWGIHLLSLAPGVCEGETLIGFNISFYLSVCALCSH